MRPCSLDSHMLDVFTLSTSSQEAKGGNRGEVSSSLATCPRDMGTLLVWFLLYPPPHRRLDLHALTDFSDL